MNWYVLKYLFNDKELLEINQQLSDSVIKIQDLNNEIIMYQEDLKEAKKEINTLLKENDILRKLSNAEDRIIDVDDERITGGRKEVDKKSPHSSFTRKELLGISKNMLAADKRLYVIELYGDTNSMEPDIDDHTLLIFEKYDDVAKKVPLSEQDIIDYKHPQGNFVHRIREIKKEGNKTLYHIKGDNNYFYDGWFDDSVIKGRYVGKLVGQEFDGETDD